MSDRNGEESKNDDGTSGNKVWRVGEEEFDGWVKVAGNWNEKCVHMSKQRQASTYW